MNFAIQPGYLNGFIENQGMIIDQNGKQNTEVAYLFQRGHFKIYLRQNGFSYELWKTLKSDNVKTSEEDVKAPSVIQSQRVDVNFEDCNRKIRMEGRESGEGVLNFLQKRGDEKTATDVHTYRKVVYTNVYKNIDLVFQIQPDNPKVPVEFHFVVHPGGDVKDIALSYHSDDLELNNIDGNIRMELPMGSIETSAPVTYCDESGEKVSSKFILKDNVVAFDVEPAQNKTLVIDPNIVWSTYLGGEADDQCKDLVLDSKGNVFVAGQTVSTLNIATSGAYKTTYSGGIDDAFFAKYDDRGNLKWCTYYGGEGEDDCSTVTRDFSGNFYIGGGTNSLTGIATAGAMQTTFGGGNLDGWFAKFNNKGQLLYATYYGGNDRDEVLGAVTDSSDNLYLTGYTYSTNNIAYGSAYQPNLIGTIDVILAKFNSSGQPVWATYYGGDGEDRAHEVCIDHHNNLEFVGTTGSVTGISSSQSFQQTFAGQLDGLVTKFSNSGQLMWSTYYGGAKTDRGRGITVDSKDNIFVIGFSNSADGIASSNGFQPNWSANYDNGGHPINDAFMVMFTPNGARKWGTYYGGIGTDYGKSVAVDSAGYLYFCGQTWSTQSYIVTNGAFQTKQGKQGDMFIAKFDTTGARIWGSYYGGSQVEDNENITTRGKFLYIVGEAGSSSLITEGGQQTDYKGGDHDAYIAKMYVGDDCYDAYEPNNSSAKAAVVKGTTNDSLIGYSGKISAASDKDWFRFSNSSATPYIKVELLELPADYSLSLVRDGSSQVMKSKHPGLQDEIIVNNQGTIGSYLVRIYSGGSAFDAVNCYDLKILLGSVPFAEPPRIGEENNLSSSENVFDLFPNPASENTVVDLLQPLTSQATISIYNAVGTLMQSQTINGGSDIDQVTLNTSLLPNGLYFVGVRAEGLQNFQKLIIHH